MKHFEGYVAKQVVLSTRLVGVLVEFLDILENQGLVENLPDLLIQSDNPNPQEAFEELKNSKELTIVLTENHIGILKLTFEHLTNRFKEEKNSVKTDDVLAEGLMEIAEVISAIDKTATDF